MLDLKSAFDSIKCSIDDPKVGLGEEVFEFVSSLTPMVNVDLLVRDPKLGTLLTWRSDKFYGPGWHVPGGVLRFKEEPSTRIQRVAELELGAEVTFGDEPLRVCSLMTHKRDVRGHFISLLYDCKITTPPDERLSAKNRSPESGEWMWHTHTPPNLLPIQAVYRDLIG